MRSLLRFTVEEMGNTWFFDVDKFYHIVYNYRHMKEIGSKTFYDHRTSRGIDSPMGPVK